MWWIKIQGTYRIAIYILFWEYVLFENEGSRDWLSDRANLNGDLSYWFILIKLVPIFCLGMVNNKYNYETVFQFYGFFKIIKIKKKKTCINENVCSQLNFD